MITSKSNDLIKKCVQIKQKKYSKEYGVCLVESIKLVNELTEKRLVDIILCTEDKLDKINSFANCRVEVISDAIADILSDAVTSDGVFAVCKIPQKSNINFSRCLVLDRIQDPANLGAIIRSACAFGYKTIFAIDSVYPYSFKSIRSSMGQIFNVNFVDTTLEELIEIKNKNNISFYVADMNGIDVAKLEKDSRDSIAIVIGNEGQGVSDSIVKLSDKTISIPMQNNVESLNASVSAGIIMYLLK